MFRKTLSGLAAGAAALCLAVPAHAQDYVLGQIIMVGYAFCPAGSLLADGTMLSPADYPALYALYGTTYGGDGQTSFGLPDLRGRVPIAVGQGAGLSNHALGQGGGTMQTALDGSRMPPHSHPAFLRGSAEAPNTRDPTNASLPTYVTGQNNYVGDGALDVTMRSTAIIAASGNGLNGTGAPIETMPPYLTLRYCVITQGVLPKS